jgi:hypothetical protein
VKVLQCRAGVGTQFLGEVMPELLVVPQGVGLAAGPVQREHQWSGGAFVQRLGLGPRAIA